MEKLKIILPEFCLIILVGPSGSGKTYFARSHFGKFETLSSDFFRGLVSGNAASQEASADAFECLYSVAEKRLARKRLTVLDATFLKEEARRQPLDLARQYHCQTIALVFNVPENICQERNKKRLKRHTPERVINRQWEELSTTLEQIKSEPFHGIYVIDENQYVVIERRSLPCNQSWRHGPFDIIGDVHGCYEELCQLLEKLGYSVNRNKFFAIPPAGRTAIFVGDFADRGPQSLAVLQLAMNMKAKGHALCVMGNHDFRLGKYLAGENVSLKQGFDLTIKELELAKPELKKGISGFISKLPDHLVLDSGKLIVAHAGIKEEMQGRISGRIRSFCIYGDVDGSVDELGLPIRKDWAINYAGSGFVVYGHTPKAKPRFLNNTVCIDTGCVFGGALSCLRYPEMKIVEVKAKTTYCTPPRPLGSD